jgi:hypothetical protein
VYEVEFMNFPSFLAMLFLWLAATAVAEEQKPRIFVPESSSWSEGSSHWGRWGGGSSGGGARPQTAEIIKTLGERCKNAIVTVKEEKANYTLLLEHEGGKSIFQKKNKFSVFKKDGDSIISGSTKSLGEAVETACGKIMQDWGLHPAAAPAEVAADPLPQP